jgi:hypothetical protein
MEKLLPHLLPLLYSVDPVLAGSVSLPQSLQQKRVVDRRKRKRTGLVMVLLMIQSLYPPKVTMRRARARKMRRLLTLLRVKCISL